MSAVIGTRRQELGAFLRTRRERLGPEIVGLPRSRRRRTPGLRREEVAQLAGVGVTWYTWLEQGREINPSPQVLESIARSLRFDPHERTHLFALAGVAVAPAENDLCGTLFPTARGVLSALEPNPAVLLNARWDILAYNRVNRSFFPFLDDLDPADRNCLWLSFTHPGWQRVLVDWDESVDRMVGEYRAAMAEHVDDPSWRSLVERLLEASPEFRERWARHEVGAPDRAQKRVRHPELGDLTLEYTNLWLDPARSARITVLTPIDEHGAARLRELHARL
ncbi:MAG: helix-turn-helix transcriptional regulator [Actinomycetota bacterium]